MRGLGPSVALLALAQTAVLNVVHARKTSWLTSSDASLLTLAESDAAEQERQDASNVRLRGSANTSENADDLTCGQGEPISSTNFALARRGSATSECFKNKPAGVSFLTDGDDHHTSPKGNKYWAACKEKKNASATVKLSNSQCIRQVRIWSRGDCCGSGSNGIIAEVKTGVVWQKCGETSKEMGRQQSWTFECAIKGSAVRIRKEESDTEQMSASELEVYVAEAPNRKWNSGPKCVGSDLRLEYESLDRFACDKFHGKGKTECENKYQSQVYGIANQCRYVQAGKGSDTWKCLTGARCMVR